LTQPHFFSKINYRSFTVLINTKEENMSENKVNIAKQAELRGLIEKVFHNEWVKMALIHRQDEPNSRRYVSDDDWHIFARITSIELDGKKNRWHFLVGKESYTQERRLYIKMDLEIALQRNKSSVETVEVLTQARELVLLENASTMDEFVKRIKKALRQGMLLFDRGCCSPSGLLVQTMTLLDNRRVFKKMEAHHKKLQTQIGKLEKSDNDVLSMMRRLQD